MNSRALVRAATAIAFAAVLAAPLSAAAQTMTFRPLPPESVQSAAPGSATGMPGLHIHGRANGRPVVVSVDSAGVRVEAPIPPAAPDVPPPPSETRETTGDIVRFGSDIDVPAQQIVDGDVVSLGGNVRVEGTVRGSVTSLGGDVNLSPRSSVHGDVVCMGGTLHEAPGSSVGGQRVTAPRAPGRRLFLPMLAMVGSGVRMVIHLFGLLVMLALAILVTRLAPGRTQAALDTIRDEPGNSFLVGVLIWGLIIPSVIVLAIAMAILCITIIGIPLAAAVAVGYVAFFVLAGIWGSVVGAALLGSHLHRRLKGGEVTLTRAAAWGVIGLQGLRIVGDFFHIIPLFGFIGGLLGFISIGSGAVLCTFGAGALVRSEYRQRTVQNWWLRARPRREGREDPLPPPPERRGGEAPPPPPPPPPAPEPPADPARYQPPATTS